MNPQNSQSDNFFEKLPKEVQDLINDGTWETRTKEVGKKYSLKDDQIENLADIVLGILMGLENPDQFKDTITKEFSISSVVADQITTDLENRVFEYAISFIEAKKKPQAPAQPTPKPYPTPAPLAPNPQQSANPKIPEVRPNTLPAQQVQSPVGVPRFGVPTATPAQNMMDNKLNNVTTAKQEVVKDVPAPKYKVDPYREPID